MSLSLVEQAKQKLRAHLKPADKAIDATLGNGHDCLFLAQQVGPKGAVLGFDIQKEALYNTQLRLKAHACASWVKLIHASHTELLKYLPKNWALEVSAVTFNLGYLPGAGHKHITTQASSSLLALKKALLILKPKGLISLLIYPGHPEGKEEAEVLNQYLDQLNPEVYSIEKSVGPPPHDKEKQGPELFFIIKEQLGA